MSDGSKAVFLSYASQDAEAARKICEALRAAGVEVWFDQSELRGGDAWDQKIRRQIKECALFVPIISANTNARPEGYFRLEWKLAVDRSHLMADDEPFLFPIGIGDLVDATARVPDKFREVQWTRLRLDETPAELAARISRLLGGAPDVGAALRRGGSTESGRKASQKGKTADGSKWWMVFPALGMLMGLMFAALPLWKAMQGRPPKPPPPIPATAASPAASESRQLALRAKGLVENGDDANRQTFATAEELLKRAVALDPSDGEAAAIYAQLSRSYYRYGFDRSQARNDLAHQLAERAMMLAPDSPEAQFAMAYDYYRSDPTESERRLREMLAQRPDDKRLLRTLGVTLRIQERREDAIAAWQKAADLPGGDAESLAEIARTLNGSGRPVEAEAAIDRSLALRASGRTLMLKMWLLLQYRGDLDAAETMLGQLPPWAPFEDRGAYQACQLWLWRRDPDKAIAALERVPREQLNDNTFTGPKRLLTGRAHQMAGRNEAARSEWKRALQLTENILEEERSAAWLGWRAWLQAALGESAAETSRRVFDETVARITVKAGQLASIDVQLGNYDRALSVLEEFADDGEYRSATDTMSAAALRLDPTWDPLRSAPRFQALVARAEQHEASLRQGTDSKREHSRRKTDDRGQAGGNAPGSGQ